MDLITKKLELRLKWMNAYNLLRSESGCCVPMAICLASGVSYTKLRREMGPDVRMGLKYAKEKKMSLDEYNDSWGFSSKMHRLWGMYLPTPPPDIKLFRVPAWQYPNIPTLPIQDIEEKGAKIVLISILTKFHDITARHMFYMRNGMAFGPRGEPYAVPIKHAVSRTGLHFMVENIYDIPQHVVG